MLTSQSWVCTNPACRKETVVQEELGAMPRCGCGSPMKKRYTSPVFRYLEFLRVGESPQSEPVLPAKPRD